ncbi:unnamed protein product [Anisakis simplex]|uniref:LisH domain-containing protein n=1 Tax=Anisakis simplex TaxID=6269 RepID=A0A0M3JCQ0_ANISI|nr:unnamed protein product [Anisakis simplex]
MPLCIDEGLELCRYALDEAKVDADAYARETGATFEDLSYLEVCFTCYHSLLLLSKICQFKLQADSYVV